MKSEPLFYSVKQVAEILGVSYQLIYFKVSQGEIPSHKISNQIIRIKRTDFDDWLNKNARLGVSIDKEAN